jgi:hypothetical protein
MITPPWLGRMDKNSLHMTRTLTCMALIVQSNLKVLGGMKKKKAHDSIKHIIHLGPRLQYIKLIGKSSNELFTFQICYN